MILKSLFAKAAAARLDEEYFYELVAKEVSNNFRKDGLWAKALADSGGDETSAKALYIKYRMQSLKDAALLEKVAKEDLEREAQQAFRQEMERNLKNRESQITAEVKSKGYVVEKTDSSTWYVWKRNNHRSKKKFSNLTEFAQYAHSIEDSFTDESASKKAGTQAQKEVQQEFTKSDQRGEAEVMEELQSKGYDVKKSGSSTWYVRKNSWSIRHTKKFYNKEHLVRYANSL
tara:strand:- start:189 stop:881 length:693 start_codon:yes stop_codon:yes gene_type:complete